MLAALLALAGVARAEAGLAGQTGLLTLPRAETVQWSQAQFSASLTGSQTIEAGALVGLPVGAAFGLARRAEVGVRLAPDGLAPVPDTALLAALGGHFRWRFADPGPDRGGLAAQVTVHGVDQDPALDLLAVGERDRRGTLLVWTGGPRWSRTHGPDLAVGAGAERGVGRSARLVGETLVAAGPDGLAEATLRLGGRWRVRDRVIATTWAGGGVFDGQPWVALGLEAALYTIDPAQVDRDGDEVPDWQDACRYAAEDADGWEDEDGCPDPDNDGDGIPDEEDETPNGEVAEDRRGYATPNPTFRMRIRPPPEPGPADMERRRRRDEAPGEGEAP